MISCYYWRSTTVLNFSMGNSKNCKLNVEAESHRLEDTHRVLLRSFIPYEHWTECQRIAVLFLFQFQFQFQLVCDGVVFLQSKNLLRSAEVSQRHLSISWKANTMNGRLKVVEKKNMQSLMNLAYSYGYSIVPLTNQNSTSPVILANRARVAKV